MVVRAQRPRHQHATRLLPRVALEEGEEEEEALLGRAHDEALLQRRHRRVRVAVVDADVRGHARDRQLGEVLDLLRLRRGEERRLPHLGQQLDDLEEGKEGEEARGQGRGVATNVEWV